MGKMRQLAWANLLILLGKYLIHWVKVSDYQQHGQIA
jgi:hypothetical protein